MKLQPFFDYILPYIKNYFQLHLHLHLKTGPFRSLQSTKFHRKRFHRPSFRQRRFHRTNPQLRKHPSHLDRCRARFWRPLKRWRRRPRPWWRHRPQSRAKRRWPRRSVSRICRRSRNRLRLLLKTFQRKERAMSETKSKCIRNIKLYFFISGLKKTTI